MITDFWSPIHISLKVSLVSGFIVIILGTLVGRIMARAHFKGKVFIETIILLPIVLPPTVVGFGLIAIFGSHSPIGRIVEAIFDQPLMFTLLAAIIASTVVAFPMMYMSAKAGFSSIKRGIEEAARIDGANELRVFWHVTLPLAIKSILAGSILSFVRALGEFGATLMFAGNLPGKTQTIPIAIYVALDSGNTTLAWLWVISVISLSFLLLLITQLINDNTD